MITCYLQGGLGNQLFQISATYSHAIQNNYKIFFDKKYHDLPLQGKKVEEYSNNIFNKLYFMDLSNIEFQKYKLDNFLYEKLPNQDNTMYIGYFQSEKYFIDNKEKILELFSPSSDMKEKIFSKYPDLLNKSITSIHVRRGDYLKLGDIHPTCTLDYYFKAVNLFPENKFYVFGDDKEWCKNNFNDEKFNIINEVDYIELYIMSLCKNNIIANSSFSWWGAWLNQNQEKKVVAPKKWFSDKCLLNSTDLIPQNWIKI